MTKRWIETKANIISHCFGAFRRIECILSCVLRVVKRKLNVEDSNWYWQQQKWLQQQYTVRTEKGESN